MDTRWYKGVKPEDKERRTKELKSYRNAFDELSVIVESLIKESVYDYDSPSWAYKQADQNGANRALREVLNLIKMKDG